MDVQPHLYPHFSSSNVIVSINLLPTIMRKSGAMAIFGLPGFASTIVSLLTLIYIMTDCQSLASSLFFKPEWLQRLLEDCKREAINCRNVKLLQQEGRSAVWNMCRRLGCLSHGVPGQACHLLERYLRYILVKDNLRDTANRAAFLANLQPKLLLIMISCVQLSAKMNSTDTHNNASVIKLALLKMGTSHTNEEIIATEAEIFKALDYRIPLWSSVDIGEVLAKELDLPTQIRKAIPMLVDIAEYCRDVIEQKVYWTADMTSVSQSSGVRSLHLSAGAVAAAVRLARNQPDPVPALATLLQLPPAYIGCLRDAIIKETLATRTTPTILKRKK